MMRGMGNMQGMMKQMQKLQKEMQKDQKMLNEMEFIGKAPDSLVKVTVTGNRRLKDIEINDNVIDPDDKDMLQDLVISAVNDAMNQIEKQQEQTMGKYSRNIPGF